MGWLLTRGEVREAAQALLWTVGSVGDVRGERLALLLVGVAVLAPLGAARARDGSASWRSATTTPAGSGWRPTAPARSRCWSASPSSPRRRQSRARCRSWRWWHPRSHAALLDDGGPALAVSGVVGATMLLGADVVGQHALPGRLAAPVGVVTGLVGAPYLIWLLTRTRTRDDRDDDHGPADDPDRRARAPDTR